MMGDYDGYDGRPRLSATTQSPCCSAASARYLAPTPTTYSTLSPGLPWGATSTSRVILCSSRLSNWTTRLKPCSVLSRKPSLPTRRLLWPRCGDAVMRYRAQLGELSIDRLALLWSDGSPSDALVVQTGLQPICTNAQHQYFTFFPLSSRSLSLPKAGCGGSALETWLSRLWKGVGRVMCLKFNKPAVFTL
jgi:hypothetical protein